MSNQSPSQTVGPFFHLGLIRGGENIMVSDKTRGQRILVRGRVIDGDGESVPDAMLEIWQADSRGVYRHPADPLFRDADPHFFGSGRAATGPGGKYWLKTIKPGAIARDGDPPMAPHMNLRVFARGMLIHAFTRLYFGDEPGNETDPFLTTLPDQARVRTLIAEPIESDDLPTYRFDVVLQGENETVFLDP